MHDPRKWSIDPRILEMCSEPQPPQPPLPEVVLQWWVDPLARRLAEAKEIWRWHGDHAGALLIQMLAGGGPELRASLAQLFAVNRDGEFFHPASEHANPRWSTPYQTVGSPAATLKESDVVRVGALAELTPAQLQQVNGVALVLVRAANSFRTPPRLVTGKPDGLGRPGDDVKVRYNPTKRARARSIGFRRMLRYKAPSSTRSGNLKRFFTSRITSRHPR
jgi:hypothetical protein